MKTYELLNPVVKEFEENGISYLLLAGKDGESSRYARCRDNDLFSMMIQMAKDYGFFNRVLQESAEFMKAQDAEKAERRKQRHQKIAERRKKREHENN